VDSTNQGGFPDPLFTGKVKEWKGYRVINLGNKKGCLLERKDWKKKKEYLGGSKGARRLTTLVNQEIKNSQPFCITEKSSGWGFSGKTLQGRKLRGSRQWGEFLTRRRRELSPELFLLSCEDARGSTLKKRGF